MNQSSSNASTTDQRLRARFQLARANFTLDVDLDLPATA